MQKKQPFENQLTRLSLVASLPLLILLLWVMIYAGISIYLILLTGLIAGMTVLYCNAKIHQKSAYQFRSLSNLLDAMIQGDYSLRARAGGNNGALDELVESINGLADRLSQQRLESVESQLLLRTVIEHIDVAIVALDNQNSISLINPAAQKLLQLEDKSATTNLLSQLKQVQQFSGGHNQVVDLKLANQQGKFNVHVEEFRESGEQQKLMFITDVRTLLRSEERRAWQNLVRVISHEINNSLAPIASISQTLRRMIERQGVTEDSRQDLLEGLTVVAERATGLSAFVNTYKQITRLPEPEKQEVSFNELLHKVVSLFESASLQVESDLSISLFVDPVQIEQVLINLFKNAVEAMQQVNPEGVIRISWQIDVNIFRLHIMDEGAGISNLENLFVPFYTTKKQGSGIGLVLCRQIIEAHQGQLTLNNREDRQGCQAVIEIPLGR